MDAADLLIVDDDASIRDALSDYLTRQGFRVRTAADAAAMDRALAAAPTDLVLLDLMMPGEDGLSACRRLADGPPVLILSALGETTDRIVGLEVGADDYLAKPFEPRELLARIRALLRRRERDGGEARSLQFAGWRFDVSARRLKAPKGDFLPLSSGESALLLAFAERPGRLLSRDQLLELARRSATEVFDRSIDLAVSRLRRKLAVYDPAVLIETVRGEGYRFLPGVRRG